MCRRRRILFNTDANALTNADTVSNADAERFTHSYSYSYSVARYGTAFRSDYFTDRWQ